MQTYRDLKGEFYEFEAEGQTFNLFRTKKNVHFLGSLISCISTIGEIVTFNPIEGWDFKISPQFRWVGRGKH